MALNFEQDDLLTALAEHGYRTDYRAFFIWEGVTQYLTEDAVRTTLEGLRPTAPSGSRMVFSYVRRDFIDGTNRYGAPHALLSFRCASEAPCGNLSALRHTKPEEVAAFLEEYGWRLTEQVGPGLLLAGPTFEATGRKLGASQIGRTGGSHQAVRRKGQNLHHGGHDIG